jgi:hypothetical protein
LGEGKIKTHSIDKLVYEFEMHYNKIATDLGFVEELKDKYEEYVQELQELVQKLGDDWSSFRYVYSNNGAKVFSHSETPINVCELKKRFDTSLVFLINTADAISPYTNYVDYIKVDNSIQSNSFKKVLHCFAEYSKDSVVRNMNEMYKEVKEGEIWFDEERDCDLHLKIANSKCYIIPMKK